MAPKEAAPKALGDKYKKHELRDHIYELPDTYAGSSEPQTLETYLFNDGERVMERRTITYVPALYKCFDEILVNALDQCTRLKGETKDDVRPVRAIKVAIDRATGVIEVSNDGDGVEVEKHPEYGIYIPELIFGNLLTSANYDKGEEKVVGGKNGIGAKLTNIFSKEFTVETVDHRHKLAYKQTWKDNMTVRGAPSVKAASASAIKAPVTKVRFLPDYARFGMEGMTDDLYDLFRRRTMDAGACTEPTVAVYFNNTKLEYKDFEHFVDLFIGNKTDRPRAYEVCGGEGRVWEVVATYSEGGQFEQVSFVNGINTLRGGKHVDHVVGQISKRLAEMISSKKKKEVKPQHIRDNLMVFVKATVVNPAFDSQTKETLTTAASKFGAKCDLSDKFMDKMYKSGIADRAVSLTDFHDKKKLVKTDGKKTSRVIVPKLDDANKAGTKDSAQCTIIFTEGDSARSMAISGLSVVGRDHYGVFPLRGKILNVRDANAKKIAENEEISAIKKILGLEQGKDYKDLSSLRYGRIMVMSDQDVDGFHVRGLLFNVFQSLWPSLFRTKGFLTSMMTPIIKASHPRHKTLSFYNESDFHKWKEAQDNTAGWTFKYYKGLGTSTAEEAKEYFRDMRVLTYVHQGKESDDSMDLAFNKKRADDRKAWLNKYERGRTLDYSKTEVPYQAFVNEELIHFSNRDLERSIPSLVDGLKESTRKILFGCFKKKLYGKDIKVAQLAGYISEVSAYHHGETSLQGAIVGMAQDFVGSNNVNLLQPIGQFGTRIQGGKDAASARYIYTALQPMARLAFPAADDAVLNYLDDDGTPVEPEYYVPIVPFVLINGDVGIGTGFSTTIPAHNPAEVAGWCLRMVEALDKAKVVVEKKGDLPDANAVVEKCALPAIRPYYHGFTGTIEEVDAKEGTYVSRGVWRWLSDTQLEVTELPIGTWTETFKDLLTEMLQNNHPLLKDYKNYYTDKKVHFVLIFHAGKRAEVTDKVLETEFKLASQKNLSYNNIHLYNPEGAIAKYKSAAHIAREFAKKRLGMYLVRKKAELDRMEAEFKVVSAKVRFIQDVVEGRIVVMNRKERELSAQLAEMGYPKMAGAGEKADVGGAKAADGEEDADDVEAEEPDAGTANVPGAGYGYLTGMPIRQLTRERKLALEAQAAKMQALIDELRATAIHHIWKRELEAFLDGWTKMAEEKAVMNTDKEPVPAKKAAAKKK